MDLLPVSLLRPPGQGGVRPLPGPDRQAADSHGIAVAAAGAAPEFSGWSVAAAAEADGAPAAAARPPQSPRRAPPADPGDGPAAGREQAGSLLDRLT